ncbi:MAG: hypothetical protein AAFX10_04305 [Pseudomonadota bacterium]
MSTKHEEIISATATLKNESSRQRWELFHRAIAHAKQSNDEALLESDAGSADGNSSVPVLSVVR